MGKKAIQRQLSIIETVPDSGFWGEEVAEKDGAEIRS